jgi:hypothetical protein
VVGFLLPHLSIKRDKHFMDNQPKKSWIRRHPVLTGIGVFIVLIILISSGSDKTATTTQSSTTSTSTTETESNSKTYQQVATFSGNGAKKSEPFTITGSRFKIAYDCKGDMCQAFVMKVGSQLPQLVMNTAGSTKDETVIYGSGEYYIDANTMGSYTMTVYDYK